MKNYTEDEFEKKFNEILSQKIEDVKVVEKPKAFILGGQPGAGKSTIIDMLSEKYSNIIVISGDDFRKEHPRYRELAKIYKDDVVNETKDFANNMTERLIEKLSDKKYNLIIEGTLRTAEVPIRTKNLLKQKGYDVELNVMLVKPEISYAGTLERYEKMKDSGTIPRMTYKKYHDDVAADIIKNLDVLYKGKEFDNILLYNRNKECLYNQKETQIKILECQLNWDIEDLNFK